jgi:hypothetical protein
MPAWEAHDPTLSRPIAAPLERCAELLGVDLAAIQEAAAQAGIPAAEAGCGMGMSDRPGYPDRLARSSGYLIDLQRCSVGRAGAKKSMSSWLTRSASS